MSFCDCGGDCGVVPCWKQCGPHPSCAWECEAVIPVQPDRTRVIGGRPGREIIVIE